MAGVTIALPARNTPLVAVRAAVIAPTAPPFPTLIVDVTLLGLQTVVRLH